VRTLKFQFPPAIRSGEEVVRIADLTHCYDDKILFLGANLEIERGDRIAFLGPQRGGQVNAATANSRSRSNRPKEPLAWVDTM
jgi:ATPase subunit of ABC transporter with duplicated ATPase domains